MLRLLLVSSLLFPTFALAANAKPDLAGSATAAAVSVTQFSDKEGGATLTSYTDIVLSVDSNHEIRASTATSFQPTQASSTTIDLPTALLVSKDKSESPIYLLNAHVTFDAAGGVPSVTFDRAVAGSITMPKRTVVAQGNAAKVGGGASTENYEQVPPGQTGSVTCGPNGHIFIGGTDSGSEAVCAGSTEINCHGGIHLLLRSVNCGA